MSYDETSLQQAPLQAVEQLEQAVLDPYGGMLPPADAENSRWYGAVEDTESHLVKEELSEDTCNGFQWMPAEQCEVAWDVLHMADSSSPGGAWVWARTAEEDTKQDHDDLVLWEAPDKDGLRVAWKDVVRGLSKEKQKDQAEEATKDAIPTVENDMSDMSNLELSATLAKSPEETKHEPGKPTVPKSQAKPVVQPSQTEPKKRSVSYRPLLARQPTDDRSAQVPKTGPPRAHVLAAAAHRSQINGEADAMQSSKLDLYASKATLRESGQACRVPQAKQVSNRLKRAAPVPTSVVSQDVASEPLKKHK